MRNKREVWRVKFTLAKIRKAARELLTLDEKDPKRLFEGTCPRASIILFNCWPMILMNFQIACGVKNSSSMRPFSIAIVNVLNLPFWARFVQRLHLKTFVSGNALLRRLVRIGVLDEGKMKLDYILGLKVEDFLERRLQTQVFKLGLAKSIHHARVLIRQRHIRYVSGLRYLVYPAGQKGVNGIVSPFPNRHCSRLTSCRLDSSCFIRGPPSVIAPR